MGTELYEQQDQGHVQVRQMRLRSHGVARLHHRPTAVKLVWIALGVELRDRHLAYGAVPHVHRVVLDVLQEKLAVLRPHPSRV